MSSDCLTIRKHKCLFHDNNFARIQIICISTYTIKLVFKLKESQILTVTLYFNKSIYSKTLMRTVFRRHRRSQMPTSVYLLLNWSTGKLVRILTFHESEKSTSRGMSEHDLVIYRFVCAIHIYPEDTMKNETEF